MGLLRYTPLFLIIIIIIASFFYFSIEVNEETNSVEEKTNFGSYEAKFPRGIVGMWVKDGLSKRVTVPPEVKAYCFDICHSKKKLGLKLKPLNSQKFECSCKNLLSYSKEADLFADKADEYDKEIKAKDQFFYLRVPHWRHMPLTYKIKWGCGEFLNAQVLKAFGIIENVTEKAVYFKEVDDGPDIELSCEFRKCEPSECLIGDSLGEAGYREYGDRIYYATILLKGKNGYSEKGTDSGFYVLGCDAAEIEIHEILHFLLAEDKNMGHNNNPDSIMYKGGRGFSSNPLMNPERCANRKVGIIDDYIIEKLKNNYGK